MRLLFLDVDGVLNSVAWMKRRPSKDEWARERGVSPEVYDSDRLTWALRSIDPEAVAALNVIVARSRARVVVSSSWRTMYALPKLEWILRQAGFRHHLIGTTPVLERDPDVPYASTPRGEEIRTWIRVLNAPVHTDNVVIVDDDADMAGLMPRLFQTDASIGLTADHVDAVVQMFTGPEAA